MTVVRVAIPVFRGKRRFHLLKGRPWSPVEHLILQAVATEPRTAATLAEQSALSKGLVIEVLICLMRADWVEMSARTAGTFFRATSRGRENAFLDELPSFPNPVTRWMTFVVDRVTGTTFRGRELPIFEMHVVRQREEKEHIVWLEPSPDLYRENLRAVFSALLEEDEKIVGVDAAGDRLAERYALVLVRNGKPEGLPKSATLLERAVIEAANKGILIPHSMGPVTIKASVAPRRIDEGAPTPKQIAFQSSDLILGGDAHKAAFVNVFKKARERIVIHSTFVSRDSLEFAMPHILDAGRRGVRVDILWGESEDKPEVAKTRELLAVARAQLSAISLDNLVAIHPFSTNSHAKLIVSDDSQIGRDIAIVGSCNWLYSTFSSFDASARLRDPTIVADVIDVLSDISRGGDRLWKPLSINLAELAREVRAKDV